MGESDHGSEGIIAHYVQGTQSFFLIGVVLLVRIEIDARQLVTFVGPNKGRQCGPWFIS